MDAGRRRDVGQRLRPAQGRPRRRRRRPRHAPRHGRRGTRRDGQDSGGARAPTLVALPSQPARCRQPGPDCAAWSVARAPDHRPGEPRTVLVSGGKMTKALQLARSFHRAGHRVVLVESRKYRFTGHRFSRAVDRLPHRARTRRPRLRRRAAGHRAARGRRRLRAGLQPEGELVRRRRQGRRSRRTAR